MSSLTINQLGKTYSGDVSVLEDINISIDSGDFLVLVGPSGCGKSTLLNMIAGLESVSTGEIYISGKPVNDLPPAERDIAMVFQSYALYPNMNVAKNMSFGMEMRGVSKQVREQEISKVAKVLQIEHLLKRRPAQLSGGQRQRVAMGRALVRKPKIFLFDEPLSNLDAKLRVEMRSEIKSLHQRMKSTIVYVTHDQIEALSMATKIVILNSGIVQQQGSPREIYNDPDNTFVASFMGSPPMNLIPAIVQTGSGKKKRAKVGNPVGKPISFSLNIDSNFGNNETITLGIRPEHLSNVKESDKDIRFLANLDMVELTGADTYGLIKLADNTPVNLRLSGDAPLQAGNKIELFCNVDNLYWFDSHSGERLR